MLRSTINPYRYALQLVYNRLVWDLSPKSWKSRKSLHSIRGQHEGKKAVVLCNGPSLNQVEFDLLEDVFSFGLNKINLIFDRLSFRPSAIVAVNEYVLEQNADFYNQTKLPLYLSSIGSSSVRHNRNVTFLHSSTQTKFAKDCSMSIYEGHTVTFVALQLAFHMGFREVALVGADHYFASKGPANAVVESGDTDENHFDPRYFSGGNKWQLPDLPACEAAYALAKEVYESAGGRIVNATEGGHLEIFPREPLKEFISG